MHIVCLTPAGCLDASIAIAASRAGALGVLNLEYCRDAAAARALIATMVARTTSATGVRFGTASAPVVAEVLAALPAPVRDVVLPASAVATHAAALHAAGHVIWAEVTDVREAAVAHAAGADGLVAKGHEAGGWVGEETAFVLLQRLVTDYTLPVWVMGGIGMHTAAACVAGGAAGVVLEYQLALLQESPLPPFVQRVIDGMDGSETILLGSDPDHRFRAYTRPKLRAVAALDAALREAGDGAGADALHRIVDTHVRWDHGDAVWPLGQDACLARPLAAAHRTVAALVQAMRREIAAHLAGAAALQPLAAGSPLAAAHRTQYPIVQGPMTRVSDTADFAWHVAEGGALPFVALALMRGREVETLLTETKAKLGDRAWGVGMLGFVPADLRQEQLEVVKRHAPPFVLIAGGRPDQARKLEAEGMTTYLHVPSPGLLRLFLKDGARHFVFEGRECGGHVGPRSSFVLWESMIDVLLADLSAADAPSCHVLFAGGVHDARSAAMVAAMAAPIAAKGVRVGVLVGTAYLFTTEAVTGGAIMPEFQARARECEQTTLIESGVGHAVRCIPNAFTEACAALKKEMQAEGKSAEEIRVQLEELNIGRLRVASKGVKRNPDYTPGSDAPRLVTVDEGEQWRDGMYMIGQVAALRRENVSIAALHHDISAGATEVIATLGTPSVVSTPAPEEAPANVAIIGIATLLPKAHDLRAYWQNILDKAYTIGEVPPERWDWRTYFDADRTAKDKVYSRWGGFLEEIPFDPLEFGMPPSSLSSIDPMQLLALKVAKSALDDAGYLTRPFNRERTAVILGASGGSGELGTMYNLRSSLPLIFGESAADVIAASGAILPEWTEDSFAGLLPNVTSGRIANRLDLGGANFVVDAACGSSLAAVHLAARELETGGADMVIVGGVDTVQTPFGFLCFSKTQALSPNGTPRTFDTDADGIAISEGFVMLVMKRLADAERDGDRIYAVLQATAASSDGKAKGLTAPRAEGQQLALQRAYAKARIAPTSVGLFEAHGTGTVVGDRTEAVSLANFLEANGAAPARHAVGSVKSMIGHTKATAGVAGLAKVALALHHKVLPATIGVTAPNPKARFGDGPLYVNAETRPWLQPSGEPRRAGVSAFGFGGTNFHAVVEEYTRTVQPARQLALPAGPELFVWSAASDQELLSPLASLTMALDGGAQPVLADLAYTLATEFEATVAAGRAQAAIVASSLSELRARLGALQDAIARGTATDAAQGVYWTQTRLGAEGGIAILFPGQGSQSPNMLREQAIAFDEVRSAFERADRELGRAADGTWLSDAVFPPPAFTPAETRAQEAALTQTNVAQPALGAADVGMLRLLEKLGVHATAFAGHSYGEFVALHAAGVFDEATLAQLSRARGQSIVDTAGDDAGTMAAVTASADRVQEALAGMADVWLANLNAPEQTVISGTRAGIDAAVERLRAAGLTATPIPVACAFHSPLVAAARASLDAHLQAATFHAPTRTVFSNTTAAPYGTEPAAIRAQLGEHLVSAVRFTEQVRAMYDSGIRVFIEAGPRHVLSTLVTRTLGNDAHVAVATDSPARPGVSQLLHALGQLVSHGLPLRPLHLFRTRQVRLLSLQHLVAETRPAPLPPTTWLVNGGTARPHTQPRHTPVSLSWRAHEATSSAVTAARAGGPITSPIQTPPPHVPDTAAMPAPAPLAAAMHAASGAEQVMLNFQDLMGKFLDTQRQVMAAYLGQPMTPSTAMARPVMRTAPAPITMPAAPMPAAPAPMTTPTPAVVPVAASVPLAVAVSTATTPAPASTPVPGTDEITAQLLRIVSDRTGYPTDMLGLDADVEADLGIDSIKRVEIVGALQRTFLSDEARLGEDVVEQLAAIRTLRGIVQWIDTAVGSLRAQLPAVQAPVPGQPAPPAAPTAAEMQRRLLGIVSERTGYPIDMLSLDADVEADLGIDSIKRIEILSAFQKDIFAADNQLGPEMMEQLAAIRSLGGIVEWISAALARVSGTAASEPALAAGPASRVAPSVAAAAALDPIMPQRVFVPVARALAPAVRAQLVEPGRTVLVTDDGRGAGSAMLHALTERGVRAVLVRAGESVREVDATHWVADLASESGVQALLAHLGAAGHRPGGLVHLAPLMREARAGTESLAAWRTRIRDDVKSLFLLLKLAGADLQGGSVAAAVRMGGTWGLGAVREGERAGFAAHAGIAGILKTAAQEWTTTHCKAIDVAADAAPDAIVAQVLAELAAQDRDVQVGYTGGTRHVFRGVAFEDRHASGPLPLTRSDVVLVTGGARGITAVVAEHLAAASGCTLVLVGRSPEPVQPEDQSTASLAGATQLKPVLIARRRLAGQSVSVREIERECNAILRDREIRSNLARLRAVAGAVEYLNADVADESAMRALIGQVLTTHGRIDVVVHGAGVIEDKRIEDKAADSFDRVFDTKADSAYLLHTLLPDTVRRTILFSSAAGAYGNKGQVDYAAANEVLNAMARQWGGSGAVALGWGPWGGSGMVNPLLEQEFAKRGIELITPAGGCRVIDAVLRRGSQPAAIVVGSWDGGEADAAPMHDASAAPASTTPLLHGLSLTHTAGAIEVVRVFDPARDVFLQDHRLDGVPVMPMAMATELAAEVAAAGWPDLHVAAVRDMERLRGVTFTDGPVALRIVARAMDVPMDERAGADIAVEITLADTPSVKCYRGVVELASHAPRVAAAAPVSLAGLEPFTMGVPALYQQWLFHGPLFQGVTQVDGVSRTQVVARLRPSSVRALIDGDGAWQVDPVVLDCGLQLVLLWVRQHYDMTPLPSRFTRYQRFAPLTGGDITCRLRLVQDQQGHTTLSELDFIDGDGRLLGRLDGLECTASKALNRLAGASAGPAA